MTWAGHVARMGDGEACTGFWWRNQSEKYHLEDPGVEWSMILSWIFRKWDVGAWTGIKLAQDRDRWRALVNAIPYNAGNFLTENRLASQRRTLLHAVST